MLFHFEEDNYCLKKKPHIDYTIYMGSRLNFEISNQGA